MSWSLFDRMKFALIGAAFGAVMGCALVFVALLGLAMPVKPADLLGFSAIYYAAVGFMFGPFVGDLVAVAVATLLTVLTIDRTAPHPPQIFVEERHLRPLWVFALVIAWLVASWFIYLGG